MTQLHKNKCFKLIFLHLFDANDQNKLYTFKDHIFYLSKDGINCYFKSLRYRVKIIFYKKKLTCNFYFEASEYSLMSKLTNVVIWYDLNSFDPA